MTNDPRPATSSSGPRRAAAIVEALRQGDELSAVFEAFEELDALPEGEVKHALESWTGPSPDPERLDAATRRAIGMPPPRVHLVWIATKRPSSAKDLTSAERDQVALTGASWDGRELDATARLSSGGEGSLAGRLELRTLASPDGTPRIDLLVHVEGSDGSPSGAAFLAGKTSLVGMIADGVIEIGDHRLREAVTAAIDAGLRPMPVRAPAAAETIPQGAVARAAKTDTRHERQEGADESRAPRAEPRAAKKTLAATPSAKRAEEPAETVPQTAATTKAVAKKAAAKTATKTKVADTKAAAETKAVAKTKAGETKAKTSAAKKTAAKTKAGETVTKAKASAAKKTTAKTKAGESVTKAKAAAKKTAAKTEKVAAKKMASKATAAKKTAAKVTTDKAAKTTTKKTAAKSTAKKTAAKKTAAKVTTDKTAKTTTKKTAAKSTAKKTAAKKTARA